MTKRIAQVEPSQMPSREAAEIGELRKSQELWRLIGDPRVRVQVPTESEAAQPPPAPASQRYVTG